MKLEKEKYLFECNIEFIGEKGIIRMTLEEVDYEDIWKKLYEQLEKEENKFSTIDEVIEFAKKLGKIEIEEVDKKIWESIRKKAEELWKSA